MAQQLCYLSCDWNRVIINASDQGSTALSPPLERKLYNNRIPCFMMQYALLNRFQGAFLGAIVGEAIACQASPDGGRYTPTVAAPPRLQFERFLRFYANTLVDPARPESPDHPILQTSLRTAEAAIALLPVFLFFHENSLKLQQNLLEVLSVWQHASVNQTELLVVGSVIAQTLLEVLDPATLTDSLLDTPSLQPLQQAQTLLGQSVGLKEAVKSIVSCQTPATDPAIALALYCFLSTPGEFRLSVLRAAQTGYHVPIVCALTGALSGAYNSTCGIPIEWRLALQQWISTTGETVTQTDLLQLATRLLGEWSGIYDNRRVLEDPSTLVVAAPQVIRKQP